MPAGSAKDAAPVVHACPSFRARQRLKSAARSAAEEKSRQEGRRGGEQVMPSICHAPAVAAFYFATQNIPSAPARHVYACLRRVSPRQRAQHIFRGVALSCPTCPTCPPTRMPTRAENEIGDG